MAELLLGTGIGLIVALLGWSDRIRQFRQETTKCEDCFLVKYRVQRRDLRLLSADSVEQKATALSRMLASDAVREDASSAQIMGFFEKSLPRPQKLAVEAYRWKYRLVITSALLCFFSGILHDVLPESVLLSALSLVVLPRTIVALISLTSLLVILAITIMANRYEDRYKELVDTFLEEHS